MTKSLQYALLASGFGIFLSFDLFASPNVDMGEIAACTKITDQAKRLSCFDRATINLKEVNKELIKKTAPVIVTETEKPLNTNVKAKEDTILISSEEAFGRTEEEINAVKTLKSNIVGEFKGWKKGAILTLANGQKWKVLSRTTGYVNLTDPKIEISRAMFGSFKMQVEGLNSNAKVKRIE